MVELDDVGRQADARLDARHRARETTLTASRQATRHAANAIRAAHRAERDEAERLLAIAGEALDEARAACADEPAVAQAGFLSDAAKEYVEAKTTVAIIGAEPLPGIDELAVDAADYLNGLAETVGELRRHVLDQLRGGDHDRAEQVLATMDDIHAVLVTIDYPDGVTGGLRRATDVARSIIERTRGDVTTALGQAHLRHALDSHRTALEDHGSRA